ncbi:MAG: hypothetical protein M3O24_02965 [Thermoproteota archaeon]|nr:hypothetical protein [Thermoproteota archaeon]
MAPEVDPNPGEKLIDEEDCAEYKLGNGILSLTNQRLIFEKTEGQLATLSKRVGKLLLDIPLNRIKSVKSEGLILTKVVIITDDGDFKFSVLNSGKWAKEIRQQAEIFVK